MSNVKLVWATPDADKLSLSDRIIIESKVKGYYATPDGGVYSPSGKLLSGGKTKHGHRTFTPAVYPDGRRGCALQHRFVAYFFMGNEVFSYACVRHLNDIPGDNRIENLALGSYKDNSQDMPLEKRKKRSVGAGYRLAEIQRKLSDIQILEMRKIRVDTNMPFYKIAKQFGVSTMTAYRTVTKQSWAAV